MGGDDAPAIVVAPKAKSNPLFSCFCCDEGKRPLTAMETERNALAFQKSRQNLDNAKQAEDDAHKQAVDAEAAKHRALEEAAKAKEAAAAEADKKAKAKQELDEAQRKQAEAEAHAKSLKAAKELADAKAAEALAKKDAEAHKQAEEAARKAREEQEAHEKELARLKKEAEEAEKQHAEQERIHAEAAKAEEEAQRNRAAAEAESKAKTEEFENKSAAHEEVQEIHNTNSLAVISSGMTTKSEISKIMAGSDAVSEEMQGRMLGDLGEPFEVIPVKGRKGSYRERYPPLPHHLLHSKFIDSAICLHLSASPCRYHTGNIDATSLNNNDIVTIMNIAGGRTFVRTDPDGTTYTLHMNGELHIKRKGEGKAEIIRGSIQEGMARVKTQQGLQETPSYKAANNAVDLT